MIACAWAQYGGWVHLKCWRVPNRVWLGLPDPDRCNDVAAFAAALKRMGAVLLSGLAELSAAEGRKLAHYCMNKVGATTRAPRQPRPRARPPLALAACADLPRAPHRQAGRAKSS